jgi:DNA-binding GntR family transcriptional regulator
MPLAGLPVLREGRYTSKKDLVLDWLREAIITGELQAGEHLRQDEVAERLGLSITPVREALSELRAAGLLTQNAHRGARVADTDPATAAEVFFLRSLLEPVAARLAAPNLTEADIALLGQLQEHFDDLVRRGETRDMRKVNYQIHMAIYRASRSPLLVEFITQLWARIPWDILSVLPDRTHESLHEHENLLRALQRRDSDEIEQITREHIAHGSAALLSRLASAPRAAR